MLTPEMPSRLLTEVEIERFWTDGVIIVRDFYPENWVTTVRDALNEICGLQDEETESAKDPRFRADAYTWHTNDRLRDFSLFAPTAHAVRQVLRSERINLFCDQIFVKQAHNVERTPWHHDFTFFPLSGDQIASVWTSTDPVTTAESALEFVAGSHRWPQRFRPLGVGGVVKSVAPLSQTPNFDADREQYQIMSWDMQPGDAVIFHALTLHGARGKPAGNLNRRAIATRWCGDDARFTPTGKELQIPWSHGLKAGDPIGGPVFPQVLPQINEEEISARMNGPIPPDKDLVRQNMELASRFEKVAL
ncbi:phytanoyl-CoA dioxygenase family protein [Mesorhizobium sp. M0047]|uniref:phytanoyl-CoA dioxygenase family protein n=1 Tax=Mesorhizobium sp. M0047 TaxID=2956859 RepID=UPI003336C0BC